jgi:hypothetical protein
MRLFADSGRNGIDRGRAGVDIEKDILAQMDFKPVIKGTPALMDERIFSPDPWASRKNLFAVSLEKRLVYNRTKTLFFVNFEGYAIRTPEDIDAVRAAVANVLDPVGHRVYAVVNYDNFSILPELVGSLHRHGQRIGGPLLYRCYPLHHQHLFADENR